MSTFKGHAKSLAQLYTYYQRLQTDGYYPRLAKYVNYAAQRITDQTKRYITDPEQVRSMARKEYKKEKRLLQEYFKTNIIIPEYYTDESGTLEFKTMVDAINSTLNLKDVYERSKILITETKGLKDDYSFYFTYFMKAWEAHKTEIEELWRQEFISVKDAQLALRNVLDRELPEITREGVARMLDGPEIKLHAMPDELKTVYKQLVDQIGEFEDENSITRQLYEAYELDKLKEGLIKEMTDNFFDWKKMSDSAKEAVEKDKYPRSGYGLEAIETAIFREILRRAKKKGKAIHSGRHLIKADNILALGIDSSFVQKAIERAGKNRNENVQAFNELGRQTKNMNEGFIVYSSDKNWTLNNNFKGYSAGTAERIQAFLERVYVDNDALDTLLGTINQLGEGAILQGKEKTYETLLAQDVAYVLFDDYATIGDDMNGNSIHIMNLNGVMIPLSMILELLAQAIEDVETETSVVRIAKVDLSLPKIEFETQDDQQKWQELNPNLNAWEYQRERTLKLGRIKVSFLRNFKDIVRRYL